MKYLEINLGKFVEDKEIRNHKTLQREIKELVRTCIVVQHGHQLQ